MKPIFKTIIVVALIVVVGALLAAKQARRSNTAATCCPAVAALTAAADSTAARTFNPASAQKLPKLLDLGAGRCIPCKMMAPILEELKKEYAGRMNVEFIDVWQNPDAGKQYGIQMIPTQIFYNADGKELFRHVGFFGKEDILGKWKELGVDLTGKPKSSTPVREDTGASPGPAANEPKPQ